MDAIGLSGIRVARRGVTVLDSVDLRVAAGERLCLLGASGSGKTSLLRIIAGLDRSDRGRVEVGGRPVKGTRRQVTMIFSEDTVYDHLDVSGNLDFPFRVTASSPDREEQVSATADRFSLRRLMGRRPDTLSAGQRRVVAAARALVRPEVEVVLMDEPLVGTDPHRRSRLVEAIMSRAELTIVIATNDPADAFRWAGRVAVLAGAAVAQTGSPGEVYAAPTSLAVAELMGEVNRIPAQVTSRHDRLVELGGSSLRLEPMPTGLSSGQRVVVGVRPADLVPASRGMPFHRCLRSTVGRVEAAGAHARVLFGLGDQPGSAFVAEVGANTGIRVGDHVDWYVPAAAIQLYEPMSGQRL